MRAMAMHFDIRKRLSFWDYYHGAENRIGPLDARLIREVLMGEVELQVRYGARWHVTQALDAKFFLGTGI